MASIDPTGGLGSSALGAVSGIAASLLAAHSARLAGAKSENAAIPQVLQAFDADLQSIVNAYNSRTATASDCIAALQSVDSYIYRYLRAQVGKPGTAWSDSVGMAGQCNKSCTAGCCVYFGDFGPPLSLAQIAMGGSGGRWGSDDPRIKDAGGAYIVTVPTVSASKYGGADRASYTLNIVKRANASNVPQYAQTDLPAPSAPLGRVSNGTPVGQTSVFSLSSQGMLHNANALSSPFVQQPATHFGLLLAGLVALVTVVVVARK